MYGGGRWSTRELTGVGHTRVVLDHLPVRPTLTHRMSGGGTTPSSPRCCAAGTAPTPTILADLFLHASSFLETQIYQFIT